LYANTGGQCSSSTPFGAEAKFCSNGKQTAKKDFASYVRNYPNAFVAQISLGADFNFAIDAFKKAVIHDGPSVIIAYSPCIQHGNNLNNVIDEEKKLANCGYASNFQYDPQNGIEMNDDINDELYNEALKKQKRYKNTAEYSLEKNKNDAKKRREKFKKNI
jgi:pyruvate-ferredoxin/flavodoxin oxidoreductase